MTISSVKRIQLALKAIDEYRKEWGNPSSLPLKDSLKYLQTMYSLQWNLEDECKRAGLDKRKQGVKK